MSGIAAPAAGPAPVATPATGGKALGTDAANQIVRAAFNPPKGAARLATIAKIVADSPASPDVAGVAGKGDIAGAKSGVDGQAATPSAGESPKPVDGSKPNPEVSRQLAAAIKREAEANKAKLAADKSFKEAEEDRKLIARIKADPYATLEELKLGSYKEWTEKLIKGEKPAPMDPKVQEALDRAMAAEKRAEALEKRALTSDEAAARVTAMSQLKGEIGTDDFEILRSLPGIEDRILDSAIEHANKTLVQNESGEWSYPEGEAKSFKDFAKPMQDDLIAVVKKVCTTKAGRAILQELLGPVAAEAASATSQPEPEAAPEPTKTVSNSTASGAPAPRPNGKESRAQIIARLRREAETQENKPAA